MRIVIYRINYYRQLSVDIKMKNYKIEIQFHDFILIFMENFYNAIHDCSVWLRTGSNPADINRFRSNTRKCSFAFFNKFET